jgi:hypothetical protein
MGLEHYAGSRKGQNAKQHELRLPDLLDLSHASSYRPSVRRGRRFTLDGAAFSQELVAYKCRSATGAEHPSGAKAPGFMRLLWHG